MDYRKTIVLITISTLSACIQDNRTQTNLSVEKLDEAAVTLAPSISMHKKFIAEVYFLTTDEGGRHTPLFNNYRPEFKFNKTDMDAQFSNADTELVTGVLTLNEGTEIVMPGDKVVINVELFKDMGIEENLGFTIREKDRKVGVGTITKIVD